MNVGVVVVFNLELEEMYFDDKFISVSVLGFIDVFCGVKRLGYFNGVCLVVFKFLNIVILEKVYFG